MRKLIVENSAPIRLKDWLNAEFPGISKSTVQKALREKDIRINTVRIGDDVLLHCGDEVLLYIRDEELEGKPLEVALIDANILVAVKPAGVLSKAEGEADMEMGISKWLALQGEPTTALACHRLDNQTGGLMIFARNAAAEAEVRALMEAGGIVKTYSCIVMGVPSPAKAVLTSYMKKDATKAYVAVFDRPVPGAHTAVTEYVMLRTDGARSLLEVKLHTGRTHQIRAQMAHIGHPILGDDKYGDREFNRQFKARRQKLWACRLDFMFDPSQYPLLTGLAGKTLHSDVPFANEI